MKGHQSGLSLLEVVFAAFIFSTLITLLSGIWVFHARAQRQTGLTLVAADLADLEMNRALARAYHDQANSETSYSQTWQLDGQEITHKFDSFVQVEQMETPEGVAMPMKHVRVTVFYEDPESDRGRKSIVLNSVVVE